MGFTENSIIAVIVLMQTPLYLQKDMLHPKIKTTQIEIFFCHIEKATKKHLFIKECSES
jgi:hypothetical protein